MKNKPLNCKPSIFQVPYNFPGVLFAVLFLTGSAAAQIKVIPDQEAVYASPDATWLPTENTSIMVRGVVINAQGEQLMGANVLLASTYKSGTCSDPFGYFYFLIPAKSPQAKLTVSYMGFGDESLELKLDAYPSRVINLKAVLKPASYLLGEIVVVGEKVAGPDQSTRCWMTVIPEKDSVEVPVVKEVEPDILVYPNPFVNHCQVDMIVPVTDAYLFCVYNGNEQLLYSEAFQLATGRVNVGFSLPNGLPAASYWLRISRGKELLCTRQLIKQ